MFMKLLLVVDVAAPARIEHFIGLENALESWQLLLNLSEMC